MWDLNLLLSQKGPQYPVRNSNIRRKKYLCLSMAQKVKLQEKPDIGVQHLSKNCGWNDSIPSRVKYELSKVHAINEGEELVKNRTVIQKAEHEGNEGMKSRRLASIG